MSVWSGIDKRLFEKNLALCRENKFQNTSSLPALDGTHSIDQDFSIPFVTERDLADGLAFLAATTNKPGSITACAVAHRKESSSLCLVLAANEELNSDVATALQDMVRILKEYAWKQITTHAAEDNCRGLILRMHRDRIFGRLGSSKMRQQKYATTTLLSRLQGLCKYAVLRETDEQLVQRLIAAMRRVESSKLDSMSETDAMRDILQSAYDLMHGASQLFIAQPHLKGRREYRDLRALAYYWRFCSFLVKCARCYKDQFRSIMLNTVEAEPTRSSNGLRRYVHAEVQIIMHFEAESQIRARYISSSKKPCFLCYCFVRGHGSYHSPASHGEVYEMWTVPDGTKLCNAARGRIAYALRAVVQDTQHALTVGSLQHNLCLQPTQTVSKLLLDRLSSNPSSTVTSLAVRSQTEISSLLADMAINTDVMTTHASGRSGADRSVDDTVDDEDGSPGLRVAYAIASGIELFIESDDILGIRALKWDLLKMCSLDSSIPMHDHVVRLHVDQMDIGHEMTMSIPDVKTWFVLLISPHGGHMIRIQRQ